MKPTILAFLLLAVLAGCKKNDTSDPSSGLPDTSSSGKNILACKINGQIHIYSGKPSINSDNGVGHLISDEYVGISGDNSKYNDEIYIRVSGTNSLSVNQSYLFNSENNHRGTYTNYQDGQYEYETENGSGWIRFSRLDKDVAAGTFEFVAYPQDSLRNDTVRVTEGRFEISQHSGTP